MPGHPEYLNLVDDPAQAWSRELDNFFVVAGVDKNGHFSNRSKRDDPRNPVISFWAPSEHILCIDGRMSGTVLRNGNSFATPIAAGLAAYFLGLDGNGDMTPKELKALMDKFAWARVEGGPKVIANEFSTGQFDHEYSIGT